MFRESAPASRPGSTSFRARDSGSPTSRSTSTRSGWTTSTSTSRFTCLHAALPKPGGEGELKKLAGRLLAEPLDRARPLWEIWIVEGAARSRVALLAKVHHCMVDGVAGFAWFSELLAGERDEPIAVAPEWSPRPVPDRDELLRREVGRRAEQWLGALHKLPALLERREQLEEMAGRWSRRASALGETLSAALVAAPETPFNGRLGALRAFEWRSLPMERARALRKSLGERSTSSRSPASPARCAS